MKQPYKTQFLTGTERSVLTLIAEGKTISEISLVLSIQIPSAELLRQSIMEKLQIFSVAGLTKYALQNGMTTLK